MATVQAGFSGTVQAFYNLTDLLDLDQKNNHSFYIKATIVSDNLYLRSYRFTSIKPFQLASG